MLRSLVGSEMCIRDRYQRRVRGQMAQHMDVPKVEGQMFNLKSLAVEPFRDWAELCTPPQPPCSPDDAIHRIALNVKYYRKNYAAVELLGPPRHHRHMRVAVLRDLGNATRGPGRRATGPDTEPARSGCHYRGRSTHVPHWGADLHPLCDRAGCDWCAGSRSPAPQEQERYSVCGTGEGFECVDMSHRMCGTDSSVERFSAVTSLT
eukprot:TRINITY_DN12693_c0_g1_i6.p1 TRINITY_DN12693_c0_g1~~TRINITY_DN12693_c0_g1_i6.p1  ORF type:complete len:206 (+),score=11.83 TRINITY_DN12693_c0_g1_i6:143-760(+)